MLVSRRSTGSGDSTPVSGALAHFKIVSFERNKTVKSCCDLLERKRCQNNLGRLQIFWTERTEKMENRNPMEFCRDDVAVTSTYWETVIRKSYSQPEKELMLAVLKDALMSYKKRRHSGSSLFKEAEAWLFDREKDRLFAFETVCSVLGLSAGRIRSELLTWKLNVVSDLGRERDRSRSDGWPTTEEVNFG